MARPWVLSMNWTDLAFLNWPADARALQATLPPGVQLETFDGQAWLSVVPFRMEHVVPRGLGHVSRGVSFTELNLRTYVTVDGVPGVWFYSLDADHALTVRAARRLLFLPYRHAQMWHDRDGDVHRFASTCIHPGEPGAAFAAAYCPAGRVFHAAPGTLDRWLTDRLCFYSADARGRLYRGRVEHGPWPLQPARCELPLNTLTAVPGLPLTGAPHALYADRLPVRARIPERVR